MGHSYFNIILIISLISQFVLPPLHIWGQDSGFRSQDSEASPNSAKNAKNQPTNQHPLVANSQSQTTINNHLSLGPVSQKPGYQSPLNARFSTPGYCFIQPYPLPARHPQKCRAAHRSQFSGHTHSRPGPPDHHLYPTGHPQHLL